MQRDAKGRFTSTDEKRNATNTRRPYTAPQAPTAPTANEMLQDLRDLARLEAAEAYLKETTPGLVGAINYNYFRLKRRRVLAKYLQKPESELFQ